MSETNNPLPDSTAPTASSDEVKRFVEMTGRQKVSLELLLGSTPAAKGKNIRRWETYGAPPTVSILMAYMAKYGFELAEQICAGDGSVVMSTGA